VAGHAVDVLGEGDPVEAEALIDLRWHRMLEKNALDGRIGVQDVDGGQELLEVDLSRGRTTRRDSMPTRAQALPFIRT